MKKYRKKRSISGQVIATARILTTVLLACFLGYIAYVVIFQGWQTLIDWFAGKWFTFAILIALVVACGSLWLLALYKRLKGFEKDE